MKSSTPIIALSLATVFLALATIGILKFANKPNDIATGVGQSGVAYANVPWKHFQNVPRFQLVDQTGAKFDSGDVMGRPMAVSFFFAECPTICRDLVKQVQKLREQIEDDDFLFVTVSVDPERDTVEVLGKYAAEFGATPDRWCFLTGPSHKFREVGRHFGVVVDRETHTDNIMLVDRFGKYRDRFKWDDPYDMKRFGKVAKDVLAENAPPMDSEFETRNVMAGVEHKIDNVKWVREFHLTDQDENKFYSRDMTGQVWIGNFFFTTCPGICAKQSEYLAGLQSRLSSHPAKIVSISTDSNHDTPAKIKAYGTKMGADFSNWHFLTGAELWVQRISEEYFKAFASGGHHSSQLYIVDKWGNVRGDFNWQDPLGEIKMLELIDQLNAETAPPGKFDWISFKKSPDAQQNSGH